MSTHKTIHGKSEIELKQFEDNSIDSCVTDPPYELSFMNRKWDSSGISFKVELWGEVYRVLKPGAHILVFGGTRTYHRMACAIEDAGFEVRDMINWVYGSGFPKSLDISKSLEGTLGKQGKGFVTAGDDGRKAELKQNLKYRSDYGYKYEPTSSKAIQWNGWGTNLKPSHEPILLARKPISEHNIASNVLKHGVGGLNIDGCRIAFQGNKDIGDVDRFTGLAPYPIEKGWNTNNLITQGYDVSKGRFPANLILECCCEERELIEGTPENVIQISHAPDKGITHFAGGISKTTKGYSGGIATIHTNPNCVCRMLDEQSGNLNGEIGRANRKQAGDFNGVTPFAKLGVVTKESIKDKGGASRFFYQAKAPQKERWFYCTICKQAYPMKERDKHIHNAPEKTKYQYLEFHPTQKPLQLIQYLIRLITPPGGTVIDPFLGSGTGLIAAEREGFNAIGIDSNLEYCLISNQRLKNEIE